MHSPHVVLHWPPLQNDPTQFAFHFVLFDWNCRLNTVQFGFVPFSWTIHCKSLSTMRASKGLWIFSMQEFVSLNVAAVKSATTAFVHIFEWSFIRVCQDDQRLARNCCIERTWPCRIGLARDELLLKINWVLWKNYLFFIRIHFYQGNTSIINHSLSINTVFKQIFPKFWFFKSI